VLFWGGLHSAEMLVPLAGLMCEEPYKLLIMDSVTAHLRVDFSGRGELAERQQKLAKLLSRLKKVSHVWRRACSSHWSPCPRVLDVV
jgi:RecA/RadA recombinase